MKPRNFGKGTRSVSPPLPENPTDEQKKQREEQRQQQAANERAKVRNEITQQISERLTELKLDESIFKGWMRDVLREELGGFINEYATARENWLLAIGGDKRDKPAATEAELKELIGDDEFAKLEKIDYRLGRSIG